MCILTGSVTPFTHHHPIIQPSSAVSWREIFRLDVAWRLAVLTCPTVDGWRISWLHHVHGMQVFERSAMALSLMSMLGIAWFRLSIWKFMSCTNNAFKIIGSSCFSLS